jgi:predicted dienelactone hydrolase
MKRSLSISTAIFLTALVALFCCSALAARPTFAEPVGAFTDAKGPHEVEVVRYEWLDEKRGREVPVKVYFPKSGDGPFPVVIFSHGLGGSREGADYLGEHWASHGYVSVHVQHKGSDESIFQGDSDQRRAMRKAVKSLSNTINRPKDVSFAADRLEKLNAEDKTFQNKLDLNRLGVAGHSFGAFTALAIAGQSFLGPMGREVAFADPRFKAAVVMSAPLPKKQRDYADRGFKGVKIPGLHMTGTRDHSPVRETKLEDRRVPFDRINAANQYLITFKDGDHTVFAGPRAQGPQEKDPIFHSLIKISTMAFWDAYLKDDSDAKAWLSQGGFDQTLGTDGTFEKK